MTILALCLWGLFLLFPLDLCASRNLENRQRSPFPGQMYMSPSQILSTLFQIWIVNLGQGGGQVGFVQERVKIIGQLGVLLDALQVQDKIDLFDFLLKQCLLESDPVKVRSMRGRGEFEERKEIKPKNPKESDRQPLFQRTSGEGALSHGRRGGGGLKMIKGVNGSNP